ncbi:MAG TPA: DivIVA domain-containing protein [Eubacteriales bacterium]|nr:DivIVA domain-containing protein [Eubacteriales bacterium]
MIVRAEDISDKVFRRAFFGYDMEQVDSFLDEVIDSILRMQTERKEMTETINRLSDRVEQLKAEPPRSVDSLPESPIVSKKRVVYEARPKDEAPDTFEEAKKAEPPAERERRVEPKAAVDTVSPSRPMPSTVHTNPGDDLSSTNLAGDIEDIDDSEDVGESEDIGRK